MASRCLLPLLLVTALLSACGGGDNNPASTVVTATPPASLTQLPGAPASTGATATDGYNWFNYRRAMVGLPLLARNAQLDTVAQGHASYLRLNNTVSHDQTPGAPGYTGAQLADRLAAAGYALVKPYAYGEVISATSNTSGFYQADELVAAIYHRFVIFEPVFKEAGAGAATASGGYTYFTCDLAASNGYGPGIGSGTLVNYPVAGQTMVPTSFLSDNETPDPVPGQNQVGYPISVHANITGTLTVQSFTVRAHAGGANLAVRQLSHDVDSETPLSAAAIIPLAVLAAATTYDVAFSGQVDGVAVTRNWSFTTQ
ncbi:CAP domain-containing protein [Rugamonas sp.]|uniref:CAP domain-containing protein n=1 Tax=Rugamonas sp. TaxID=1926287 RepID=UPI0025F0A132|nr:CAP domain-containing protein [Rugamonas sp.]